MHRVEYWQALSLQWINLLISKLLFFVLWDFYFKLLYLFQCCLSHLICCQSCIFIPFIISGIVSWSGHYQVTVTAIVLWFTYSPIYCTHTSVRSNHDWVGLVLQKTTCSHFHISKLCSINDVCWVIFYVDNLLKAFIRDYNMINSITYYNMRYLVGSYVKKVFAMIEVQLAM